MLDQRFAYLMLNERNGYIKIGSSRVPHYRERTLQSQEPEVVLLATRQDGATLERQLHRRYASDRLRGEWFKLTPLTVAEIIADFSFVVPAASEAYLAAYLEGKTVFELMQIRTKIADAKDSWELMVQDEFFVSMGAL